MPDTVACGWRYFQRIERADIDACLADWRASGLAAGALAFVAERSGGAVEDIQQAFADASLPLMGMIYPELVVDGRFEAEGLLLFGFSSLPPHILLDGLEAHEAASRTTVEGLATFVDRNADPKAGDTLFLAFDCMVPNIGSLIEGLYAEVGDVVTFAGANAGSESFQPMPCLFDESRIRGNAVLAILLRDHPGAVLDHGYQLSGKPVMASSTSGNRVDVIAGRSAFDQYRVLAREQQGVDVQRENFYQVGVHFPFGLVRMDGDILVRIPVALTDDDSIFCVGEIPQSGMLTVVGAVEPGDMGTVRRVADRLAQQGTHNALFFYCAGRRMHLQAAASSELSALQEQVGYPVLGALSLGEIGNARRGGYPLFHNATLVGLPWPAMLNNKQQR